MCSSKQQSTKYNSHRVLFAVIVATVTGLLAKNYRREQVEIKRLDKWDNT